jgi:hypothetical protein
VALGSDSDGCSSNLCDTEEGYLKKKKIHNLGPVLVGSQTGDLYKEGELLSIHLLDHPGMKEKSPPSLSINKDRLFSLC